MSSRAAALEKLRGYAGHIRRKEYAAASDVTVAEYHHRLDESCRDLSSQIEAEELRLHQVGSPHARAAANH